jgi:hypothetical protein
LKDWRFGDWKRGGLEERVLNSFLQTIKHGMVENYLELSIFDF